MKYAQRNRLEAKPALLLVTVIAASLFTPRPSFAGGYYWSTTPTVALNNGGTITHPTWPGTNQFISGTCNGTATITMSGGVVTWVGGGTPTDLYITLDYASAGNWNPTGGSVTLSDSNHGFVFFDVADPATNCSYSPVYSGTPPVLIYYSYSATVYDHFDTTLSGATVSVPTYTETIEVAGGGGSYNFEILAGPIP